MITEHKDEVSFSGAQGQISDQQTSVYDAAQIWQRRPRQMFPPICASRLLGNGESGSSAFPRPRRQKALFSRTRIRHSLNSTHRHSLAAMWALRYDRHRCQTHKRKHVVKHQSAGYYEGNIILVLLLLLLWFMNIHRRGYMSKWCQLNVLIHVPGL